MVSKMDYQDGTQYVVTETMQEHQARLDQESEGRNRSDFVVVVLAVVGLVVMVLMTLAGALH